MEKKSYITSPRLFSVDHELDIKSSDLHQMQLKRIPKVEILSARKILALRKNLNATREVMAALY